MTTTYRMPVADCVERMRAVSHAIQHEDERREQTEDPAHRQPQQQSPFPGYSAPTRSPEPQADAGQHDADGRRDARGRPADA